MTNYIMDLRNMNIVLVIITVVGICGFLLLRIVNGRSSQKRRQRTLIRNKKFYKSKFYGNYSPQPSNQHVIFYPEEVVPSGYYFHSQSTSEPWKRMKTSSNQRDEMEENDFFDIPPDMTESGPNGSVSYKYRDREDLFRPYMKKGTKAPLEIPEKRTTDIHLSVEKLPYVDS